MFQLDTDLPEPLRPLAWLIGRWQGAGVVGYPTMSGSHNFGQEIVCSFEGRGFLEWRSTSWLLDNDGNMVRPSASELGYWRPVDGGEVELLLVHPTGILEMYAGTAEPARVELHTDSVIRSRTAKEYSAATRMYGLVNSDLMWVMDMAAMGHPPTAHASAQLKRVDG